MGALTTDAKVRLFREKPRRDPGLPQAGTLRWQGVFQPEVPLNPERKLRVFG